MRITCFVVATALVRGWTRLYTWRMEPATRASRLEEIESDLWEHQRDPIPDDVPPALHVLVRLVIGVPSDLRWRVEQAAMADPTFQRRAALAVAVIATVALWMMPAWLSRRESAGRTRFDHCANAFEATIPGSLTRADYRVGVVTCAGAFFANRLPATGPQ